MSTSARAAFATVVTVAAMVTAACGTAVDGVPVARESKADLATLEFGKFSPEPSNFAWDEDDSFVLGWIESQRLLSNLVLPTDIDPDLVHNGTTKIIDYAGAVKFDIFPPESENAAAAALEKHNVLAGAYSARSNGERRSLKQISVMALLFPTPAAAGQATADLDAIFRPTRETVVIPKFPAARALAKGADATGTISFYPHGRFVVMVLAGTQRPDRAAQVALVEQVTAKQVALLDAFRPTPRDDILDIPADRDSMMRRAAAPENTGSLLKHQAGVYDTNGELHFEYNPAVSKQVFGDTGVDLVARRDGIVYRARDPQAAVRLQSALAKPDTDAGEEPLPAPEGLPDAQCVGGRNVNESARIATVMCFLSHNRYVAVVGDRNEELAHQRAAAQYAILVKNG